MADRFGAITIPADTPDPSVAAGDPSLSYLLGFLAAFLEADEAVTRVWSALAGALPVVKAQLPHNPNDIGFNTAALPALYAWREGGHFEWRAEDWAEEHVDLRLLWVFPIGTTAIEKRRATIANALCKALFVGLERGRTPGWVVPGDTDPDAGAYGSNLYTFLNSVSIDILGWKRARVDVTLQGAPPGTPARDSYRAIEVRLLMRENLEYDVTRYPYDPVGPLEETIKNEAGEVVDEQTMP